MKMIIQKWGGVLRANVLKSRHSRMFLAGI